MFTNTETFSGFSVNDLTLAKQFYGDVLGIKVEQDEMGLTLRLGNGSEIFVYAKPDHQPATFTILNFVVENIDDTIDQMLAKGIKFEKYNLGPEMAQDEKGILRGLAANMGPDIAWFKDPAGNILAILQNK